MKQLKEKGFCYGALLYAFLIPFPQKMVTVSLIVWTILSFIGFNASNTVRNKRLLLLPLFYFTYFIGFLSYETLSLKFLEHKLSLLVFPLLFFLNFYDQKMRDGIYKAFVWGLVVSAITCFFWALYNSLHFLNGSLGFQAAVEEGKGFMESILYGGNFFFGRHLSVFHQTVYYALYLCSGVAILLFVPRLLAFKIRVVLLSVFTIFVFLISNKAGFIGLSVVFALKFCTWQAGRNKKIIGAAALSVVLMAFMLLNPRVYESAAQIAQGNLVLNPEARYGFSTRLLSWDTAISLIKDAPILGYGYGGSQKALNKRYEINGYTHPLKEQYNAHNLWLQSWLENGLLAIILLFWVFYVLFKESNGSNLFLAFTLLLLINSLFEGLFNRFSGISFIAFLVCFIFSIKKVGGTKS
ncbi:O-antigen ligase family protein [Maribacter sp. 2307ULW6-5]|uniref:O-antigen ligase family protein n=1 Tax=Maribacter sp. 2307ULW6-5 TaxID=3386275 RepID=UPI0039BCF7A5